MDAPATFICPATGHTQLRYTRYGKFVRDDVMCPTHGVPLFRDCDHCRKRWPLVSVGSYSMSPNKGANFCAKCAAPAPWLTREDIIRWIQSQIQVAKDLAPAARQELREVLERLQKMDADDKKAVPGWEKLRDAAPKVWESTKPVRDTIIGEAVKKILFG